MLMELAFQTLNWLINSSLKSGSQCEKDGRDSVYAYSKLKGLILAQNERWRHGLGMQVEREVVV
jgi:hypothetical protein